MKVSVQSASDREVVVKVSATLGWFVGVVFLLAGSAPIVFEFTGRGHVSGIVIGAFLMLFGLLTGLLSRYGTIRLSVDDDQVQFRLRNLLGMEKVFDSPLGEIVDAKLESYLSGGRNQTATHRVVLVKNGGKRLPLTFSSSSVGQMDNRHVVEAIQNLLKEADKRRAWFEAPSTR